MGLLELSETAIRVILYTLGVALFGIIAGLFYKGLDRKISAHMQGRIGPPIRQPFRDVRKLFTKENIVPENAIPWLFNTIPLISRMPHGLPICILLSEDFRICCSIMGSGTQ